MILHDHLRRDSRMSAAGTAEGHRLFRPEALEAQRQALPARIPINTPLAHWLLAAGRHGGGAGRGLVRVSVVCPRHAAHCRGRVPLQAQIPMARDAAAARALMLRQPHPEIPGMASHSMAEVRCS